MDWQWWLGALALFLIFEGLTPFIAPQAWKQGIKRITELSDGQVRFVGLCSLLIGLLIFVVVT
jgi:uncharacterized protein YjeT (DUF2065 family)